MKKSQMAKMRESILVSIPVLFLLSAPLHFAFDLLGKSPVIGAFVPVNESPWEHLKLVFFPILVWWILFYIRNRKQPGFSTGKWIVSTCVAVVSAVLTVIFFFYSYTGALGVEIVALDIFSALLAVAVGQCLGYHVYKYSDPSICITMLALLIVISLLAMFVVFTFNAPHIPLFLDSNTGTYGI